MLEWELLLRIVIGTLLGGVIGFERDFNGRPAGLRTHMLVALASATFMVVSTHFVFAQDFGPRDLVRVDASRIASSIVTGMGFLAGGAIIRTGLSIQGLTTAAALWLVGAIGMAAGGGMYGVAVFSTLVGIVSLTILRRLEDKGDRTLRHRVEVSLGNAGSASEVGAAMRALGVAVTPLERELDVVARSTSLVFEVGCPREFELDQLLRALEAQHDVRRITMKQIG